MVYLNSCSSLGATTFPLAIPFIANNGNAGNTNNIIDAFQEIRNKNCNVQYNEIQNVAKNLILQDVQHTRMLDANERQLELGKVIDDAAVLVAKEENNDMGLRILPKQGHFCLFSSLKPDGYPNPLSFHGGEAMDVDETKDVLTFFYEIPVGTFHSRQEFGRRVVERERHFINLHFS